MKFSSIFILALALSFPSLVFADNPRLAFTDLISGPSYGLNDGQGEGTIITVWGNRLEDTPGSVLIEDVSGVEYEAAYIYYWKRADGTLPGGPADLSETHNMYEVAFSIPSMPVGDVEISLVTANGHESNSLPFTVREGNIYHVSSDGSNNNGDGSFSNPWNHINGLPYQSRAPGNGNLDAGDIVYSHGVKEPSLSEGSTNAGLFLRSINGTLQRQVAIAAYPGTQPVVESPRWGLHPYQSSGIVVSKYVFKGGLLDDPMDNSQHFDPGAPPDSTLQVKPSAFGRVVGNRITDSEGKCSNGWAGAISGNGASAAKIYGNYVHDIGCIQTSHFHHTTYMSKRSSNGSESEAWEFGWNRFDNNMAKFGIHFYDQSPFDNRSCDPVVGTFKIHDNYIVNQRGTGINVRTSDHGDDDYCWEVDTQIFNNVIINSGLGPIAELNNGTSPYAIQVGGDILGNFTIENNLVYGISDASAREYETPVAISLGQKPASSAVFRNNIVYSHIPMQLLKASNTVSKMNNLWFIEGASDAEIVSRIDQSDSFDVIGDPLVRFNGAVALGESSPAVRAGVQSEITSYGYYGFDFDEAQPFIGPFQLLISAPQGPSDFIKIVR